MFDAETVTDFGQPAPRAPAPTRYELALANMLRSPEGKIVIRKLLADAGVARSVFNADPAVMAFQEGQRNLGLRLFADIARVSPTALPALLLPESDA